MKAKNLLLNQIERWAEQELLPEDILTLSEALKLLTEIADTTEKPLSIQPTEKQVEAQQENEITRIGNRFYHITEAGGLYSFEEYGGGGLVPKGITHTVDPAANTCTCRHGDKNCSHKKWVWDNLSVGDMTTLAKIAEHYVAREEKHGTLTELIQDEQTNGQHPSHLSLADYLPVEQQDDPSPNMAEVTEETAPVADESEEIQPVAEATNENVPDVAPLAFEAMIRQVYTSRLNRMGATIPDTLQDCARAITGTLINDELDDATLTELEAEEKRAYADIFGNLDF